MLIKFYVVHQRQDDAINELRTAAAANPADLRTELELVGLLGTMKGPDAAHAELAARINAGVSVFPYQIGLAKLDFVQGHFADSTAALEKLISSSTSPDDIAVARATLA